MSRGIPPEAADVLGRPDIWRGISRDSALAWLSSGRVVVMYTNYGFRSVAWFGPDSPFFHTSGPYDYAALRYFIFAGGVAGGTPAGAKGGIARKPRKQEASQEQEDEEERIPLEQGEEFEEMEEVGPSGGKPNPFLKTTGQVALGIAKVPPKPEIPKQPIPPKPEIPKPPELVKPEIPKIPDKPALPEVPKVPDLPKPPKLPIEIQLVDAGGKPIAGAKYSMVLPDQSRKQGKSDASGFIRVPDNLLPGEVELILEELGG